MTVLAEDSTVALLSLPKSFSDLHLGSLNQTFVSPMQVQRSGALHVSRHTVYVGGLSAQVHHIPAGANSPARLSISVDAYSTADDEGTRISINNWKPLHGKTMNIIAIHSDLDLFFDLSTDVFASSEIDTESSRPELELPIHFSQGGTLPLKTCKPCQIASCNTHVMMLEHPCVVA